MNLGVYINVATVGTKQEALELDKKPLDQYVKKNGLYVLDEMEFRANTLVRNWNIMMYAFITSNGTIQAYDTSNTLRTLTTGSSSGTTNRLNCNATAYPAGSVDGGILVGTGTNATTISSYALQTKITHGTGAGQLQYSAMNSVGVTVSAPDAYHAVDRLFTNSSGGNITIKEIGLVVRGNSSAHHFLIDRTLQDITINNGTSKTITYKLKITV